MKGLLDLCKWVLGEEIGVLKIQTLGGIFVACPLCVFEDICFIEKCFELLKWNSHSISRGCATQRNLYLFLGFQFWGRL